MAHPSAPANFYTPSAYRREESLDQVIKRVMQSIVFQIDRQLVLHGLTNAQLGPLMHLHEVGASTVAELARSMRLDAGAVTRVLDRLEKKGLCKRTRWATDRRVVRVELTPGGTAALAKAPGIVTHVLNLHLAGFSRGEWMALQGYLRRMLEAGESMRGAL